MKKRKTNQLKLWAIGILAIFLLAAAPSAWAQGYVDCEPEGSPYNFYTDDILGLNISADTTVNLYPSVQYVDYVYVAPGGILNIYSGSIGWLAIGTADPEKGETDAIVTVYGTDFQADWQRDGTFVSLEGATEFTPLSIPTYDNGSILEATDKNGYLMNMWCLSDTPIYLVDIENEENDELIIDIKPGSDENVINLKSRGVVPVAVITTDGFKAGNINPDTVEFAGASPVRSTLCDVDKDGDMDMLFHFRTQKLNLNENSTEATLKAMLKGVSMLSTATYEDVLKGTDKVKIMSSKKHSFSKRYAPKQKRYEPKPKRSKRNHKNR